MPLERLYTVVGEVENNPETFMKDYMLDTDGYCMAAQPNHDQYIGEDENGMYLVEVIEQVGGNKMCNLFRKSGESFEEERIEWEEAQNFLN